jgi:hypothetical protein
MLQFNEVPVGRKQGSSGDAEMRSLKGVLLSRLSKELAQLHGIAGAMEEGMRGISLESRCPQELHAI